jgi:hypothetical protein
VDHWVLMAQSAHYGSETTIACFESIVPLVGFFIFKVILETTATDTEVGPYIGNESSVPGLRLTISIS